MANNVGAPIGNTNARRGRQWTKAIERAVEAWPNRVLSLPSQKGIDDLAYDFVGKMREEKDLGFYREFGDRLEGKPAQVIIGDASEDAVQVEGRIRLVRPDAKEGGNE